MRPLAGQRRARGYGFRMPKKASYWDYVRVEELLGLQRGVDGGMNAIFSYPSYPYAFHPSQPIHPSYPSYQSYTSYQASESTPSLFSTRTPISA